MFLARKSHNTKACLCVMGALVCQLITDKIQNEQTTEESCSNLINCGDINVPNFFLSLIAHFRCNLNYDIVN